jgi:hypothetical protein
MPRTAYFDVNICLDVFEQKPELFPELEALVASGKVRLLISDLDLAETLKGNHLPTFHDGIERVLSLSATWLFLTGLATREAKYEYARYRGETPSTPFLTFAAWTDFLPLITSEEERASVSADLLIPTANALLELYPPHSITERLKTKWRPELKELGKGFPDLLEKKTSLWRLFWHTTANTLERNQKSTKDFARRCLWKDPDRAPAYRLDLELTFETLDNANPKWKENDFLDHVHAGALPYVDLFVTQDGPLLGKLAWYDENVRKPAGKEPYMPKVCSTWAEFITKASEP